ncbi:hypothetical protein [Nocardia sp. NPDC006630]
MEEIIARVLQMENGRNPKPVDGFISRHGTGWFQRGADPRPI